MNAIRTVVVFVAFVVFVVLTAACRTAPEDYDPNWGHRPQDPVEPVVAETPKKSEPNFELAWSLEFSILQFSASNRRVLQEVDERRHGLTHWPDSMRNVWSRMIIEAETALENRPGDFPIPLLLRSGAAIDAELDEAKRHFKSPPEEIRQGVGRVHALLDKHFRSPDSPKAEPPPRKIALAWPVSSHLVTSPFGHRRDPIIDEGAVRDHKGIDIAAASGESVKASAPGRVVYAGWSGGGGNTVMVQHAHGYVSMYAHLEELLVGMGAYVGQGTTVGVVGNTGRSTAAHLHFEVRRGGVSLDPMEFLPAR